MALLAAHSPDPELRGLYGELVASEARHFGLYWMLAEKGFGRQATVARLQELAAAETQSLTGVLGAPEQVRMHSVGVNLRDLFDMA
jgi:tRNA-(ms[2]io[6]A)-hydroxylase